MQNCPLPSTNNIHNKPFQRNIPQLSYYAKLRTWKEHFLVPFLIQSNKKKMDLSITFVKTFCIINSVWWWDFFSLRERLFKLSVFKADRIILKSKNLHSNILKHSGRISLMRNLSGTIPSPAALTNTAKIKVTQYKVF